MDETGYWQSGDTHPWGVAVDPYTWLVGPPLSELSGVTLPRDHWIYFAFQGVLADGSGGDIIITEMGKCGEQALVFLTDGNLQDYLLGLAKADDDGSTDASYITFDLENVALPFEPFAVRIVALDREGGSPGFDIGSIFTRIADPTAYIASDPFPINGAENVNPYSVLNFSGGIEADRHMVYFGTSLDDVNASAMPVDFPAQPQDSSSFDPLGLELGQKYFWRIDEINDLSTSSPWTGDIWSFTVDDRYVLEDFDFYNETSELELITSHWSSINTWGLLHLGYEPVKSCYHSMYFSYYFDKDSESAVVTTFEEPEDFTIARVLELYFYGNPSNIATGPMYIWLSDGVNEIYIPYDGDMSDVAEFGWHPWRVNLTDINEVNLQNIVDFGITFKGDPQQPSIHGSGILYFDDISLRSQVCLDSNFPPGDLNNDCCVDLRDFGEIARLWRRKSFNTYPVLEPNAPVLWYTFDNNTVNIAGSSDGIISGYPEYVTGVFGQALSFDGVQDFITVSQPQLVFGRISDAITISFWHYGADSGHLNDTICCSDYVYNDYNPSLAINIGCWRDPAVYHFDCGSPWSFENRLTGRHEFKSEYIGNWNHWVFVKDVGDKPGDGVMKVYLNGKLIAEKTGSDSPISSISSFVIGMGWYGGFDGLLDDFRIYSYALSQEEIAYIGTNGSGFYNLKLLIPADFNNDNRINFKDIIYMAEGWLQDQSWP